MVVYDPRGHTWDSWCALMAELFAPNQLGTLPESRWKEWASAVTGIGYFTQSGVPDPRGFENWQDWAAQMTGIMSVVSSTAITATS
jgi:hypothetical protein